MLTQPQSGQKELRREPLDIIYILGPGYCGSTLLNLCLDRHSAITGVSEIVKLNRKRPGWSGDENAMDSPFWNVVDQVLRESEAFGLGDIPFHLAATPQGAGEAVLAQNHAALRAVLSVSCKRIVADASKDLRRLEKMLQSPLFRVRVIYLVRDGRAVVHAYRRKYGDWWSPWRKLMQLDRSAHELKAQHNPKAWLTVRYEDMVKDLERTLGRICDFSNISFETDMLKPDTRTFNGLGGNRLRNRPIEKVKLDTAWQTEMSPSIRMLTALAVWKFNHRHGFETPLSVQRHAFI